MSAASKSRLSLRSAALRAAGPIINRLGIKERSELKFWNDVWAQSIRDGALWGPESLELSGDTAVADTYEQRRWQQARAEVGRVLKEAKIDDADYFNGKVVMDIGPGCVGFPDACPAAVSIGVDPLAEAYAENGLLLESNAVYLSVPAEEIPLRSASLDVVVCRNSLDHVVDPAVVVNQIFRLLRPGGELILNVDVDHPASPTEPHEITIDDLHAWLTPFEIVTEDKWDHGHADDEHNSAYAVVVVARKPATA